MSKKNSPPKSGFKLSDWLLSSRNQGILLCLIGFLIYANAIPNNYALDDEIVIQKNKYTQEGLSGLGGIFSSDPIDVYFNKDKNLVQGGRYRPLSIATFALEIELFGENPQVSHFVNAALYGLLALLLFQLLVLLVPPERQGKWFASTAFLIALLFTVHPIHTEAVANIKGRDEILALLLGLLSFKHFTKHYDTAQVKHLLIAALAFFLALLSKESIIPFIAVIPLAPWFFRDGNLKRIGMQGAVLLLITVGYIALRASFVGLSPGESSPEILNNPFANASFGERMATISHTLGLYLWKMLVPHPLTHDYYPWQIPITNWADWKAILSAFIYLGLALGCVWGFLQKKKFAFGLLLYFATLSIVSNIFFSIGTTMGERFVFIPSLGFLMALIWAVEEFLVEPKRLSGTTLGYATLAISAIFIVLTVMRNPVWKDNYTLFTTDVETSPNSAKLRTSAGGAMIEYADSLPPGAEQARNYREALGHLEASLAIYPEHAQTWLLYGNAQYKTKNPTGAIQSYQNAMRYKPNFMDAYQNAAAVAGESEMYPQAAGFFRELCRFKPGDVEVWFSRGVNFEKAMQGDSAIFAYQRALKLNPSKWEARGNMALVYGRLKNDLPKAIYHGEEALKMHSQAEWLYENLGVAYGMSGLHDQAIQVLQRGLSVFPNSAKLHLNLGVTFQNKGDLNTANQYFSRAVQLDPSLKLN